jgi:hypothetical protein
MRERIVLQRAGVVAGIAYRNMREFSQILNVHLRLFAAGGGLRAHDPTGTSLICYLGAFYIELHQPIEALVLLEDQRSALENWQWQHLRKGRQKHSILSSSVFASKPMGG